MMKVTRQSFFHKVKDISWEGIQAIPRAEDMLLKTEGSELAGERIRVIFLYCWSHFSSGRQLVVEMVHSVSRMGHILAVTGYRCVNWEGAEQ